MTNDEARERAIHAAADKHDETGNFRSFGEDVWNAAMAHGAECPFWLEDDEQAKRLSQFDLDGELEWLRVSRGRRESDANSEERSSARIEEAARRELGPPQERE